MISSVYIKHFRNFKEQNINIADRLNLISGANGLGKSTLLGIITSGSGTKKYRTINNSYFHPEFGDYFILTKDEHRNSNISDDYYEVILSYHYKEHKINKRMRTSHPNQPKLKLIPRTIDENGVINSEYNNRLKETIGVTGDGRIPIPTIFVSMSRLFPFGESGSNLEDIIRVSRRKNIPDQQKVFTKYVKMYNSILPGSINEEDAVLFETSKPKIGYNAFYATSSDRDILTQSVGQDSLSGIINAVLSFYNISKTENYKGGLLCIDELDASLHPDAQKRLLRLLKREANNLNLQIIFTSHSLTIIKEMIKLANLDKNNHSVIYLRNRLNPFPKYEKDYNVIKADLFNEINYSSPKVKIYVEDSEAKYFFEQLINIYHEIYSPSNNLLINCEIVVSQISCKTLLDLPKKDDYFKDTIIVLDGDAKYNQPPKIIDFLESEPTQYNPIKSIPNNVLFLPGDFSPEGETYRILYNLSKNEEEHERFWNSAQSIHGNYYPSIIRNELNDMNKNNQLKRGPLGDWFNSHRSFFAQSNIYKYYYLEVNKKNKVKVFGGKLERLIEIILQRLKSKGF